MPLKARRCTSGENNGSFIIILMLREYFEIFFTCEKK